MTAEETEPILTAEQEAKAKADKEAADLAANQKEVEDTLQRDVQAANDQRVYDRAYYDLAIAKARKARKSYRTTTIVLTIIQLIVIVLMLASPLIYPFGYLNRFASVWTIPAVFWGLRLIIVFCRYPTRSSYYILLVLCLATLIFDIVVFAYSVQHRNDCGGQADFICNFGAPPPNSDVGDYSPLCDQEGSGYKWYIWIVWIVAMVVDFISLIILALYIGLVRCNNQIPPMRELPEYQNNLVLFAAERSVRSLARLLFVTSVLMMFLFILAAIFHHQTCGSRYTIPIVYWFDFIALAVGANLAVAFVPCSAMNIVALIMEVGAGIDIGFILWQIFTFRSAPLPDELTWQNFVLGFAIFAAVLILLELILHIVIEVQLYSKVFKSTDPKISIRQDLGIGAKSKSLFDEGKRKLFSSVTGQPLTKYNLRSHQN